MKKGLFLILSCVLLCWGCYDEIGKIGESSQPKGDRISIYADTCYFSARTEISGPAYARSITTFSQLGQLYAPEYGTLKMDYLCQFYLPPGYTFPECVDDKIDSVSVEIHHTTWTGDPGALMQAEIVTLSETLTSLPYTDINPEDYTKNGSLAGKRTYTAASNPTFYDSNNEERWRLSISVDKEIGQRLYDESRKPGENAFSDQNAFNKFFKGLYITTTGGSGCILNIDNTLMDVYYQYYPKDSDGNRVKDMNGNDSIAAGSVSFSATQEVIQLNRVESGNNEALLQNSSQFTYLKTPAGLYTVVTLPIRKIVEEKKSGKDGYLNTVNFAVKTYPREAFGLNSSIVPELLMILPDSIKNFFEQRKIMNLRETFVARFDTTALTYNFGNISAFIKYYYQEMENTDRDSIDVALIPVRVLTDASGSIISVGNFMRPSLIRLRQDDSSYIKIPIISSKF